MGPPDLPPSLAMKTELKRCPWLTTDPLYQDYHDKEWGVPVHDDRLLFEMINLEGAQAGLSWLTVLKRRESYREAFDQFDPVKIVAYNDNKLAELLLNPGIIRHRLKIAGAVQNARGFLNIVEREGTFSSFLWKFVGNQPKQNAWVTLKDIPASTPESIAMSKALKAEGFTFCGPTICYAFMQAVGMVNDHTTDCFRHKACRQL
jgi:DNA-3-methyladenine glycosylase I